MAQQVGKTKGNRIEDLELENIDVEKLASKKEELVMTTWLSEREADIYLLYNSDNFQHMKDVAETLGINRETAYQHWRRIKDKRSKSERFLELDIS